jgi:hypothetical protein
MKDGEFYCNTCGATFPPNWDHETHVNIGELIKENESLKQTVEDLKRELRMMREVHKAASRQ